MRTSIIRFCSDSFSKYFSTICCYTYINLFLVTAIRGGKLNAKPWLFKTYILLVKKHKAKISSWPSTVSFSSPSLITSIPLMCTLYNAWLSGTAHWVTLTTKQLVTFLTDMKSHLGDQPVNVRKQRSDKNKKWKQLDEEGESGDEDGENGNKVTKLKKSKTTPTKSTTRKPHCNVKAPLRSRSVINDSNEEEGS